MGCRRYPGEIPIVAERPGYAAVITAPTKITFPGKRLQACLLGVLAFLVSIGLFALAWVDSAPAHAVDPERQVIDFGPRILANQEAGVSAAYLARRIWWKKRVIKYWNGTNNLGLAIQSAAKAWNASGAKIKWVKVKKRSKADVPIVRKRIPTAGLATTTFDRAGKRRDRIAVSPSVKGFRKRAPRTWDKVVAESLIAHEMGHIVGLGHSNNRCAVMYRETGGCLVDPKDGWKLRCQLLNRDDLRGIRKIRGGKIRPQGSLYCSERPASPPVGGLLMTVDPGDPENFILGWTVPQALKRPDQIRVFVSSPNGNCDLSPESRSGEYEDLVSGKPGARQTMVFGRGWLDPLTDYCFSVFAQYSAYDFSGEYRELWSNPKTVRFRTPG